MLRMVAGGILAAHGYVKLFGGQGRRPPEFLAKLFGRNFVTAVKETGPEEFGETLEKMEVPAPAASAYVSAVTEFGGGLALLAGYRTRMASLPVLINMGTAIRKAHWRNGLYGEGGFELPLMLATAAGTLLLTGPGAISLDALGAAAQRPRQRRRQRRLVRQSKRGAPAWTLLSSPYRKPYRFVMSRSFSFALPNPSLTLPLAWSPFPSASVCSSPVTLPAASFSLPPA
jgi:putative oxidoreductase